MTELKQHIKELYETILILLDELSTEQDQDQDYDFQLALRLDKEGNMSFDFNWPNDINPVISAQVLANFLYNLQAGNVNTHIIQGLKGFGVKVDQSDMTDLIIQKFSELISVGDGEDIAVKPNEFFQRGGE